MGQRAEGRGQGAWGKGRKGGKAERIRAEGIGIVKSNVASLRRCVRKREEGRNGLEQIYWKLVAGSW